MRDRIINAAMALAALVLLAGCATKQSLPELPSALGEKGLLVARLYILGMQAMEDASVNVDGKFLPSAVRDGYVAIALEPGDHTLVQLKAMGRHLAGGLFEEQSALRRVRGGGGGPRFIYIPGGSYTVYYTTLAVDRSFHIDPGKVTNLGLIVYLPVPTDPKTKRASVNDSRNFNVVALDNGAEIGDFLRTNYPELVGSMKSLDIALAPGSYLDSNRLPSLRRLIAAHESFGPHRITDGGRTAVFGRAGTIALVNTPAWKEPPAPADIRIVDTGTLADIVGAAVIDGQFIFLTSDANLLSLYDGGVTRTPLPARLHPVQMHALGDSGLVVVDNHLRILTTRFWGDKWITYEGAMQKTPRSDVAIASDGDGVYIGLGNMGIPSTLLYLAAGSSAPKPLPAPDAKPGPLNAQANYLVARDAGLFVMFSGSDFYFWSKALQKWALHSVPPGKCRPVQFDDKGVNLSIQCGDDTYSSSDSGATWSRGEA